MNPSSANRSTQMTNMKVNSIMS